MKHYPDKLEVEELRNAINILTNMLAAPDSYIFDPVPLLNSGL